MSSRITIQKIDKEKEKDPPSMRMGFLPYMWSVLSDWQLLIVAAFCIMMICCSDEVRDRFITGKTQTEVVDAR